MSSLVYFPSFEPQNDKWLKFSLLYLNEFRPIIPDARRGNISDLYKSIIDETDLINPYSPEYIHGEHAGIKSIEEIDRILVYPNRYEIQFNNISPEEWKNKDNWNYIIYKEKFSYVFQKFCLENNLGKEVEGGITVSEEVGYIFMKNLANEISNDTNSSIITDSKKFQNYDRFKNENNQDRNEINSLAESVINLRMPVNITDIEFNEIIRFRNRNRDLIKNFQIELEKIKTKPDNISAFEFLREFDNVYSKSIPNMLLAGFGMMAVPLSIYSYLDNTTATNIDELKSLVLIASGGTGSVLGIKNILSDTNNKRQCIKYFANLDNLL